MNENDKLKKLKANEEYVNTVNNKTVKTLNGEKIQKPKTK